MRLSRIWRTREASPRNAAGTCGLDEGDEIDLVAPRGEGEEVDHFVDAGGERKRLLLEHDLAGLDLGEVEDLVDQGEQGVAALADGLDVLALFRGRGRESSSRLVMPRTPFIGVRSSWLTLATNSDFRREASSAPTSRASALQARLAQALAFDVDAVEFDDAAGGQDADDDHAGKHDERGGKAGVVIFQAQALKGDPAEEERAR